MPGINNDSADVNEWANFWYYNVGVDVFPANTIEKKTYENWSQWHDKSIPQELHEQRKKNDKYNKGIAILLGKIPRGLFKEKYLVAIDLDNKKAIEEFIGSDTTGLEELKQVTFVEQHSDPNKMHIYFIVDREIPNKASDKTNTDTLAKINANEIPAIEVKGNRKGIMFCSPSPHENGSNRRITGTLKPKVYEAKDVQDRISAICNKYDIPYGSNNNPSAVKTYQIPINDLWKPETKILKGHNRHLELLRIMESLLQNNRKMPVEDIKQMAQIWNQNHCEPPLDDNEFERQWKDALKFTTRNSDKVVVNKFDNDNHNNNDNNKDADNGLLEKIKEHCIELFVDQYNVPHVSIKIDNHVEVLSLNSRRFKNLLYKICYNETKKLNSEKIEGILNILKADAEFCSNKKKLNLRIAKTDDYIFYYDLTNNSWTVIKMTPDGWKLEEASSSPILFKRYSNQMAQVIPIISDNGDIFDKFMDLLNLKDEKNRLLLKCYIISLFIPEIAKPILILHGEQGSAKSTLEELIKMLVDPSILKTLSFPRDINELIQQLAHNYIAYFDNISSIPYWISDVLCRAVTGSGFSKRQLFTDDDDFIYTFLLCVGINGINLGAIKADLLDRSIIIQLERIPKKKRRKTEDLWKEFNKIKPQLLGYILHIVVKVLNVKKKGGGGGITLPDGFNRMADFEEYGEIISRCMGNEENKFLQAYQENVGIQIDQAIEANPLSTVILQFMNRRDNPGNEWEGTATQLLSILNEFVEKELKMNNILRIKTWPKSPNKLSGDLNEVMTNLREKGIVIERYKDKTGNKIIKICKVSPIPSYRQESTEQAQGSNETFGDTKQHIDKVSSKQDEENQAQKNYDGRFGDTDDTLHTFKENCTEDEDYGRVNSDLYECYYCNKFAPSSKEVEYQRHVLNCHPQKRLYPFLSELEELGIKPKGKRWEK